MTRPDPLRRLLSALTGCLLLAALPLSARARVVINEVFYHGPNDLEDLQWVELHNSGAQGVDLTGWRLTKGVKFRFPAGTRIEPKGFLVLAQNGDRFKQYYDAPLAGLFSGRLGKSGDQVELVDRSGKEADAVRYADSGPWPAGADGYSGSLERICPEAPGDVPENWTSSPLSPDRTKPGGTPGQPNAGYVAELPPVISGVKWTPEILAPGQPLAVEAEVRHAGPVNEVSLLHRTAAPGKEGEEVSVPMTKRMDGRYEAVVPAQAADQLIRFRIRATAESGVQRLYPAATGPRPALSAYVRGSVQPGKIPMAWIVDTTEAEAKAGKERARTSGVRGFGPQFFLGGVEMGPPGEGPDGPPPQERARDEARKRLERGLNLSRAWFELTVRHVDDPGTVAKLSTAFAAEMAERRKATEDILESPQIEQKLEGLPRVVEKFQGSLLAAVKPLLSEPQAQALAQTLQKSLQPAPPRPGLLFDNPAAVVRDWVKLEDSWFALTARNLDPARYAALRRFFQQLDQERVGLETEVAALTDPPEGLRDLRERAEALSDKLATGLKPLLSAAQQQQLDEAQRGPEAPVPMVAIRTEVGIRGPGGPEAGGEARGETFPPRGGFGGERRMFKFGPGDARGPSAPPASGKSAFVYFDPGTGKWELFDFVDVVARANGQKIHFHKDRPFREMNTINLIYEGDDAVLVEPLAYEVFRRAGVPTPTSYQVRLQIDGQPAGYQLLIEQPNRSFLRRNRIRDDGNLYKILWYEQGVVGQHEKKTRVHSSHEDIVQLIDALEKTSGAEQWEVIRKNFEVEEVANYFAVSIAISNWDGFFNNYFTYHNLNGTGRWTMFPWDEDQTWGIAMMMRGPESEVFYNMPITFGMNGDAPPGQAPGSAPRGFFGFGGGGAPWWRQPGWFSGPLLANPQFRAVFLAQLNRLLDTVYTEDVFGPILDAIGERLRPEVRTRAQLIGEDPDRAAQDFDRRLDRLREHLQKRRAFLLADKEVAAARRAGSAR